jgi:hypothetical protein
MEEVMFESLLPYIDRLNLGGTHSSFDGRDVISISRLGS